MYFVKRMQAILAAILVLVLAAPAWAGTGYAHPELLIETDELAKIMSQSNVRVVDGVDPGTYNRAHIPGAVNIFYQLLATLKTRKENGFPASPQDAEKIFGEAGIDNNTLVVVYDGGEGPIASAVWFALDFFGDKNVKVLNGGFRKWVKEGRPVTQDAAKVEKKKFTAVPHPEKVIALEGVKKRDKNTVLADTRSFKEFIGQDVVPGAARGGHIPGAVQLEWTNFSDSLETFKSADDIKKALDKRGVNKDTKVITYCQIGLGRSTMMALAMKLVGYDNVIEYSGSWEEWAADPRLPLEK
ncbi:MAG: sulfurtransferase [Gammaproteobacteria bacterium]|nr:sulfurtransferase [Gammaproteobacteria bacterium]